MYHKLNNTSRIQLPFEVIDLIYSNNKIAMKNIGKANKVTFAEIIFSKFIN